MTNIELDKARMAIRAYKSIADSLTSINWEQRRYEITKTVLPIFIGLYEKDETAVKQAIKIADTLIDKLKTSGNVGTE